MKAYGRDLGIRVKFTVVKAELLKVKVNNVML